MPRRFLPVAMVGLICILLAPSAGAALRSGGESRQRAGIQIEPNGLTQHGGFAVESSGWAERSGVQTETNRLRRCGSGSISNLTVRIAETRSTRSRVTVSACAAL